MTGKTSKRRALLRAILLYAVCLLAAVAVFLTVSYRMALSSDDTDHTDTAEQTDVLSCRIWIG